MPEEYGIFWGDELYDFPTQKVSLIENILYENDTICISAAPGVGKSILALQLMFNLTTGKPFLDTFKVNGHFNVLYVQTEGDRSETLNRILNMKKGVEVDDRRWVHMNLRGVELNTDAGMKEFLKVAKKPNIQYSVIIIDPLYTTVRGSMNSDDVATSWVRNARTIKAEFDSPAMIVMHHDSKDLYSEGQKVDRGNNDLFGSVFWSGFFNHNFKLKTQNGVHYLERGKQRSGNIVEKVAMKMMQPAPLMFVTEGASVPNGDAKLMSLLKDSPEGLSKKQAMSKSGMSESTFFRAAQQLKNNNLIDVFMVNGVLTYRWKA